MLLRALFFLLIIFAATPWCSPPVALVLGMVFGIAIGNPFPGQCRKWSKFLLQAAVVGLGFGMNLYQVLRAGRSGFLYTLVGIAFALGLGTLLARLFSVESTAGYLISVGTAICGGSAIAAVGPVVEATGEEMSVSVGTVFLLNAVGLLLFPPLGHRLGLSQSQFGLWAALAIHDTSSVVGAAVKYGATAVQVATTVKLARALWIVPVTLATAAWRHTSAKAKRIPWPWFIGLFLLAAVANTFAPRHFEFAAPLFAGLSHAGQIALTVTLFLIGAGITRASLREVGARPLMQGVTLWLVVSTLSLVLIRAGWAHI